MLYRRYCSTGLSLSVFTIEHNLICLRRDCVENGCLFLSFSLSSSFRSGVAGNGEREEKKGGGDINF